jgi:hypothetical protein
MRNASQAKDQGNKKYPFLPDNIWSKMSSDETKRYRENWHNKKDPGSKGPRGFGHQYPRLNKANNAAKVEKNGSESSSNNGQIWRPGGPPRKANALRTIRHVNSYLTNPAPPIEPAPHQDNSTGIFEETSSDEGSFHTPSSIDSASEAWFTDTQISIATKPAIDDPVPGSDDETETVCDSESEEIKRSIIACDALMTVADPAPNLTSLRANLAPKFGNPAGIPARNLNYPRKPPHIWIGKHVAQSDEAEEESSFESCSQPPCNHRRYSGRELFPAAEATPSLSTPTKAVTFTKDLQEIPFDDVLPGVPETTEGPWYGMQISCISGVSLSQDFQDVQNHLTEPGFVEYLKFASQLDARAYADNRYSQCLELSISEGRGAWYKGHMPYSIFNQLIQGVLPLEPGKGFCSKCGTHGTTNTVCPTCAHSYIDSHIASLHELADSTRHTCDGELILTKISHGKYASSIKGYEPRISSTGYVSWFKTPVIYYQRLEPKFVLRLPEERGVITLYNSKTPAAPSTSRYTRGISSILKTKKNKKNCIIAFHIRTDAAECVTVSVSDAYIIDPERVYTHLFANRELGFSGVEKWRRHDVMKIISHRLAPLSEIPTIIAFLCNLVTTNGDQLRVELPVEIARDCNEREVVGYIFQNHLEFCSGARWIRFQWPYIFTTDCDTDSDTEPPRSLNAITCRCDTNKTFVRYNRNQILRHDTDNVHHALIDSGADTTGLGGDIWVDIVKTGRHAGILAYNNELLMDEVPIVSATAAHDLPDSTTILLQFNEATFLGGESNTLISPTQLRDHGIRVDDVPARYGGNQSIFIDGLLIPLLLKDGMLTLPLRRPTEYELRTSDKYHLTSARHEWAPHTIHSSVLTSEQYAAQATALDVRAVSNCNTFSSYLRRLTVTQSPSDWEQYQSYLLDCNEVTTKKTLECTTRLADLSGYFPARQYQKSRFPWANVLRLNDKCATDTVFSTVTSYEGFNCMQWFAFHRSHYQKEYGMRSEGSGPNALLDFFRDIGAPMTMRRDNSKMQTSDLWEQYLRQYNVRNEFIEPYQSQQNPSERQLAIHKDRMKRKMITTGCDPRAWFKLSKHVSSLNNRIARKSINWRTPYELLYGSTPDISPFVIFEFWEPVYYTDLNTPFPNNQEKIGRFMGIAEDHGNNMCFWILTNETEKLIVRSYLRSATDATKPNASLLSDFLELSENDKREIKERTESEYKLPMYHAGQLSPTGTLLMKKGEKEAQLLLDDEITTGTALNFDPGDVIFNINPNDLIDKLIKVDGKPTGVVRQRMDDENFRIEYKDGKQDMLTYNELIEALNRPNEDDTERWTYDEIISHRSKKIGPNKYERQVLIKWDTGELSWEPLLSIKKDDPVTLAEYARRKNLLEQTSWNWAKRFLKSAKSFKRYNKQMQLAKRKRRKTRFKFGQRVPRTIKEAQDLDLLNQNTRWQDAIDKEIKLLVETYGCFKVLAKGERAPKDHEFIPIIWVFDIKVDGRYRPRAVAGGHVTEGDPEDGHAVMADLETVRLAIVAAALFDLKIYAADVSHAYIQAFTNEKVYTVAGPEFGPLEGCVFIIVKALYGLRTSGARWAEKLNDTLRSLGFTKSNAGSALWIRRKRDHYEYMSTLVDDILIYSKEPEEIIKILETLYDLKGIGLPDYYSGADWSCDKDGDICLSAKTYVKNVCEKIEKLLDVKLKNYGSPLEPGDHPEMDETDLLTGEEISLYQMLVGSGQWAVTLTRFDIQFAVNSMARFSNAPREGHMKRMLRVFGYLKYHEKARIKFDVTVPNYDGLEFKDYDWSQQYPGAEEEIHPDAPESLKTIYPASITCYCDADHAHCLETRRSVTGIILFVNKTPVKWYSKRQNTVESSTYGSELVAARIASEIVIDFRGRLRLLGIAVTGPSVLLIDNQSVVANMTLPSGTLKKKHNSIAFHKVRFLVTAGVITVAHIRGTFNVADVETKSVSAMVVWYLLSMLLYGRECTYADEPEGELQKTMILGKPVYVDLGDLTPVPGRIGSSPDIAYNGLDSDQTARSFSACRTIRVMRSMCENTNVSHSLTTARVCHLRTRNIPTRLRSQSRHKHAQEQQSSPGHHRPLCVDYPQEQQSSPGRHRPLCVDYPQEHQSLCQQRTKVSFVPHHQPQVGMNETATKTSFRDMQKQATAYCHQSGTAKSAGPDVCSHPLFTAKKNRSKWIKDDASNIIAFRGNEWVEGRGSINEHDGNRINKFEFSGSKFLHSLSCKEQGTRSLPSTVLSSQGVLDDLVERSISAKEERK